jgi:hypothetical protein
MDGQQASWLRWPLPGGLGQAARSSPTACGVRPVAINFQLVIDGADPERLCRFGVAAHRYELEPPPDGFTTWEEYWRDVGVPEEDLGIGAGRISDPGGAGPRIWFQVVPEGSCNEARTASFGCAVLRVGLLPLAFEPLPLGRCAGLNPAHDPRQFA